MGASVSILQSITKASLGILIIVIAFMVQPVANNLTNEDANSIFWNRLKDFDSCKYGEFLLISTRACEPCTKYYPNGASSDNLPLQCAAYFNMIDANEMKMLNDDRYGKLQDEDKEIAKTSASQNGIYIPIIIVLAVLVSLLIVNQLVQYSRNYHRGKRVEEHKASGRTETSNIPDLLSPSSPRAFTGSRGPLNNRSEDVNASVVLNILDQGTVRIEAPTEQ